MTNSSMFVLRFLSNNLICEHEFLFKHRLIEATPFGDRMNTLFQHYD